jgi:hypothetical protein
MTKTAGIRIALISALSLASAAVPVSAQPGGYYIYFYTYYSDASQTQVVGTQTEFCYEPASVVGDITPYYTRERRGYYSYTGGCVEY